MLSPLRNRAGRRLREPFGKAGLTVAVIALVFAMVGGAWAAAGLNGKQKKEVKSIAKGFQGTGPAGAAGPAGGKGDNGAAGSNGKDGTNGTNGTNGVSPTGTTFAGSKGGCAEGGVEFKGANTTFACNGVKGANGTTGFTETLPPGKTETGVWGTALGGLTTAGASEVQLPFSFSIRLATGGKVVRVNQEETEEETNTECTGTLEEPTAPEGTLCVYTAHEENEEVVALNFIFAGKGGYGPPGTILHGFITGEPARFDMNGSWAVTGAK